MSDFEIAWERGYKKGRKDAIDEFVQRIEKNQTHHDSYSAPIEFDMGVDMADILEIAEQMKE